MTPLLLALGGLLAGCSSSRAPSAASADTQAASPIFPDAAPGTCHYPIVLEHGFAASNDPSSPWAFVGVVQDLMSAGHVLVVADEVQPFGDVKARAATMATTLASVQQQCAAMPGCNPAGVHVIAHSFGGLHSREYLLEHPPQNAVADGLPAVVSLTTVSTPNYGTNIADVGLQVVQSGGVITEAVANAFAGLFGSTFTSSELASDPDIAAALNDLSEANAPAFAAAHPAAAGVSYFAWAGVSVDVDPVLHPLSYSTPTGAFPEDCGGQVFAFTDGSGAVHDFPTSLALQPAHDISGHGSSDLPNDGMATVASAKSLPGSTFMGCFPSDHLAEVGNVSSSSATWTGFDHKRLYRYIAGQLAALEPAAAAAAPDAGNTSAPDAGTAGDDGGDEAGDDGGTDGGSE
jgi:triacylglycerol esterase/lipase EstA (alpha/beta hydrolase family)